MTSSGNAGLLFELGQIHELTHCRYRGRRRRNWASSIFIFIVGVENGGLSGLADAGIAESHQIGQGAQDHQEVAVEHSVTHAAASREEGV